MLPTSSGRATQPVAAYTHDDDVEVPMRDGEGAAALVSASR